MAAPQDDVGRLGFDDAEDRGEIGVVLGVFLVGHELVSRRLQMRAGPLGDGDVEAVIGGDQRHLDGLGIELAHHLDGAGVVVAGRRQGPEDVFIAAGIDLARGAAALDHRNLVLLGDGAVVEGIVRGEGPEQEVDLVRGDQPDILADAEADVRLVVIELEGQLVGLVADLDAALGVDGVDGELIGVDIVAAGIGLRARGLQGGAEGDDVVIGNGRDRGRAE